MTQSANVINFRKSLIDFLIEKGHKVTVVAGDDEREKDIIDLGVSFYSVKQNNRGLNPFSILNYYINLKKIIKTEKPDFVFTFQLKPNLFGIRAARKGKVKNIYGMVEGVGDVYLNKGLKWKIIRIAVNQLYKKSLRMANKVFFLNNEDKNDFIKRKLVCENKCELISGIGVDLNKYSFKPLKNENKFLMVGRMLKTKGIIEYCKCARLIKQQYNHVVFEYLGPEGTVKLTDIKEYIDDGSIIYLGCTTDVRPYLEDCSVVILPSYREGMPVSIMEAQAVGRAVITSDAVGCKDTVKDGYNGFLCKTGDYMDLAEKIKQFIGDFEKTRLMGENARKFAVEHFDSKRINEQIYEVINENSSCALVE